MLGAVLLMGLAAGATASAAMIMEPVFDQVLSAQNEEMLWPLAGGILVIFFVKGASTFGHNLVISTIGRNIIAKLQQEMFATLIRADLSWFQNQNTGTLVTRFTYDVQQLYQAVAGGVAGIGLHALSVIFLLAIMFIDDWQLTFLVFGVFVFCLLPMRLMGLAVKKVSRRMQNQMGQFSSYLFEAFRGIRQIKTSLAEERENQSAHRYIIKVASLERKFVRIKSLNHPVMELLGGISVTILIVYGGHAVLEGEKTTGEVIKFITALLLAYEPMKKLTNLYNVVQQGMAAADRVFATIDLQPKITCPPQPIPITKLAGNIKFDQVSFSYQGGEDKELHDISLVMKSGQKIALVGPSGAGKTSLLNLIPRFYDPQSGKILIDGIDIRDLDPQVLRRHIALVSQETFLFSGTIANNICYGLQGVREEDMIAAAKMAAAHDFICTLAEGYHTEIGEDGIKLSGGQRQRIAIARAMLKNAPILLLDEASSALDSESERQIQQALEKLMQNRTTIMVAHRLATIKNADQIFVLDQGHLVEKGTHEELLGQKEGVYARLWSLQQHYQKIQNAERV